MKHNDALHDKVTPAEIFFTIWGWTMFVLVNSIVLFISPLIIIFSLIFDRDKKLFIYVLKFFFKIFCVLNFVQKTTIDKNGLKAPKKGERRIYVVNHASMFDVIIMLLLPGPIKSIMKESYMRIPVIGWIAVLAGNIVLKESTNTGNRVGVYMNVVEKLERGSPVVIYPEGTKSKDSKIGRFYEGTFKIALDTKSDLVPVVFDSWNIIRPGGMWIRDVHHDIKVLDTIKYEDFKDKKRKQISKEIRIKLLKGLLEVRDARRKSSKSYYRHKQKYVDLDNQMREELKELLK